MKTIGKTFKYGDHVDTDVIIPARFLTTSDPKELSEHCMEDIDKDYIKNVEQGDIIVGGENFGCGSSREHAPIAIKASGAGCVIAKSFARIFFRNCINVGFPILECPEAVEKIDAGDKVEVDFTKGEIKNNTKNEVYKAAAFPPFLQKIIQADGLINYAKNAKEND